ncbi:MAG: asparaginase domain-containing protein [Candidatus Micrarchaeota archaeon]
MAIKVLVTGGTIDGIEYESIEDAPKSHESLIPGLLREARVSTDYSVEILMSKDSRFVTDDDRKIILERCKECEEGRIIITHGTFTMPDTAKYLGKQDIGKTIVLFGSAVPANKEGSDALFNLGAALMAVQLLPAGVYVIMNGRVFSWDNVKKNLETGYFEREE